MIDEYATHQEILVREALASSGDILETGCGYYSTPILLEICKARESKLVSLVQDKNWAEKFKHLVCANYQQIEVDFTKKLEITGNFGLVFLDHEQLVAERVKHIPNLLTVTRTIVVHDSNRIENFSPFLDVECSMEHFRDLKPNTAVIRKC